MRHDEIVVVNAKPAAGVHHLVGGGSERRGTAERAAEFEREQHVLLLQRDVGERHRHHNCDEFFIVLKGHGHIYTDDGQAPSGEGDIVYSPRKCWHGFNNTSNEDVVLVWGWMGAGSIEASGYEVAPDDH